MPPHAVAYIPSRRRLQSLTLMLLPTVAPHAVAYIPSCCCDVISDGEVTPTTYTPSRPDGRAQKEKRGKRAVQKHHQDDAIQVASTHHDPLALEGRVEDADGALVDLHHAADDWHEEGGRLVGARLRAAHHVAPDEEDAGFSCRACIGNIKRDF